MKVSTFEKWKNKFQKKKLVSKNIIKMYNVSIKMLF